MSKTALALKLLTRLSNGALYKKKDLALFLEVPERKLIELRYDLIEANFYIETIPERYGGYRLDKHHSSLLSTLNINNEEFSALKFIQKTMNKTDDKYYKNFTSLVEKMELIKRQVQDDYEIINPVYGNRLIEKENQNFTILMKAIQKCHKIRFKYKKLNAEIKEFTMHPYELFYYKGFWYLLTYNEKYKKAYQYKLVRMNEITILNEKYEKSPHFILSDFTGDTSVYKNELFYLELEIKPPQAILLSEIMIAKNQEIIHHENGCITFKGTMEGKVEIISWLLSLGDDLLEISPPNIKEEYINTLDKMCKNYLS